jgi:hypothetical protein
VPHASYWSGLFLSLVMLIGAPLCFYGGLARGEFTANNSNSNNEEHEERSAEEAGIVQRLSRPPAPRRRVVRAPAPIRALQIVEQEPAPVFVHLSRFSERRLI